MMRSLIPLSLCFALAGCVATPASQNHYGHNQQKGYRVLEPPAVGIPDRELYPCGGTPTGALVYCERSYSPRYHLQR